MPGYKMVLWSLFVVFLVAHTAYLHRVPGLLGDEGSEGENVYELLEHEGITVVGERSYIGPAIDYIRVPFVTALGASALSLRLVILGFSIATFWLAAAVLRQSFGDTPSLFALAAFAFSPIFLLYGRIGWAITLYPFFAFLILFLLQRPWRTKWLWAGLAAGLGLANHIVFLPTLVGVAAGVVLYSALRKLAKSDEEEGVLPRLRPRLTASSRHGGTPGARRGTPAASPRFPRSLFARSSAGRILLAIALVLVGFWAGFGMQFAVLQLQTDDQGDSSQTTQLFGERVRDAFPALPLYLSGSSFAARYTGIEFSPTVQLAITAALVVLGIAAIALNWKNPALWAWAIGLHAHLFALLYVIDRFTLRYLMVYALGVWLLAGLGLGSLLKKVSRASYGSIGVAIGLSAWMAFAVLVPFLRAGGSTADFGLGNRTDSAAAFVDVRPLIACIRGQGAVFSENVHIWNRLQYLSHSDPSFAVLPEDQKGQAETLVDYRTEKIPQPGDICAELRHFSVNSR